MVKYIRTLQTNRRQTSVSDDTGLTVKRTKWASGWSRYSIAGHRLFRRNDVRCFVYDQLWALHWTLCRTMCNILVVHCTRLEGNATRLSVKAVLHVMLSSVLISAVVLFIAAVMCCSFVHGQPCSLSLREIVRFTADTIVIAVLFLLHGHLRPQSTFIVVK